MGVLYHWYGVYQGFGGRIHFENSVLGIFKHYIHLRGVLECVFKCPGKKISNMVSPGNLTTRMRTASKFCAHICAASPETFVLDLISQCFSGIIVPWPECHSVFLEPGPTGRGNPPPGAGGTRPAVSPPLTSKKLSKNPSRQSLVREFVGESI